MSDYKSEYAVAFEIKIALEVSSFVLSEYRRYLRSQNISPDDEQNSDLVLYRKLAHLRKEIYNAKTMEDVKKIEDVFTGARSHLKEIYEDAV